MANLFKKAAETATPKSAKAKEKKLRVSLSNDFFDKMKKLEVLNTRLKQDKAEADIISDEIKEVAKVEWSKLYDKTKRNPGSIMLEAKDGLDITQCMFLAQDKYLTITPERAEDIKAKYGDDLIEERNTFSFDSEMIEKYGEILSDLIENCNQIPERDKESIIVSTKTISIKKGVIDDFSRISTEYNEEVFDIFEQVKPVVALKGVELIKG